MTKTISVLRATLAVFGLSYLAACGGGGNDQDVVPAGAKVCELQLATSPAWPYNTSVIHTDFNYTMVKPVVSFNSAGRYQVTSTEQFYVNLYAIDAAGNYDGRLYIVGSVAETMTLASDLAYSITYAPIIGTVGGNLLLSSVWYEIPRFGSASGREIQPSDVLGVQVINRDTNLLAVRALRTPDLELIKENVFQVRHQFSPGSWPYEPDKVSYDIQVSEDCYHCGKPKAWSCALRDLKDGDTVAIIGGERGKGTLLYVGAYTSVVMDDGQTAISKPATLHIQY